MRKLDKKHIRDIFALTPIQEGMLYHYLKEPESGIYFEQLSLEISGHIDPDFFKKALEVVVKNNEMLRTVFRWEKLENPVQMILKKHQLQPEYYDYSAIESTRQKNNRLQEIKANHREKNFNLLDVPFRVTLSKFENNQYEMIISYHHILCDGWSIGIILTEFLTAYTALVNGNEPVKPEKSSFKEFVAWSKTRDKDRQVFFWNEYLSGFDTITKLPVKTADTGETRETERNVNHYAVILEEDIKVKIVDFVTVKRLTLAAFFYGAWGILLQKYCNTGDVLFGTTISGRSAPIKGIENMAGLFINTIPLRVRTETGEKVGQLLGKVNESLRQREKYEHTPLVDIAAYSGLNGSVDLFDSLLVIENYPLDIRLKENKGQLTVNSYSISSMTNYDLTVGIDLPGADHYIRMRWTYNRELLDDRVIRRLAGHFTSILKEMAVHPGKQCHEVDILSRQEKKQLLEDFNRSDDSGITGDTGTGRNNDRTVQQLFAEQVNRTPDQIAQVGNRFHRENETISITYQELNQRADGLANRLKEKGLGPDSIVGVMANRCVEIIILIFGILKSGGAYLPIDPDYPPERRQYILNDSSAGVVLTAEDLSPSAQLWLKSSPPHPSANHPDIHIHFTPDSHNLAYVIYTSGSTGKPKGVMVEHGNVNYLVHGLRERIYNHYHYREKLKVCLVSPFVFDASVKQIFGALLLGNCLCIVPEEVRINGKVLFEFYKKLGVNISDGTPTHLQLLLEHEILDGPGVQEYLIGGEPLSWKAAVGFLKRVTGDAPAITNVYGPTECTVDAASYRLTINRINRENSVRLNTVPLGQPLPDCRIYILDAKSNLQPIYVPGELCIMGQGVSRGYLNRPILTLEKFVNYNKKFLQKMEGTGGGTTRFYKKSPPGRRRQNIYKTGDLARWLPGGNIEFLGRIDQQVKIRGYRIELGEIESRLLARGNIRDSVVVVKETKTGDKYLCAYIVPGKAVEIPGLKDYLSGFLPDYMIPAAFVILETIPFTPNGKVDRKSLPEPGTADGFAYEAPRDEVEKKLVEIWADVLETDRKMIGIDNNFFHLGGHSLKAARLTAKIHKAFDVKLPLGEVFKNPSIKELATSIKNVSPEKYQTVENAEKKEYYPLSSSQHRLYILARLDPGGTNYNISGAFVFAGKPDPVRLEEVFHRLIDRHESFRTSFHMVKDEPVQRIHPQVKFEIEHYNTNPDEKNHRLPVTITNRPPDIFDLSRAPLLRVGLLETGAGTHLLMVSLHHIISDGLSIDILRREIEILYQTTKLPCLKLQYRDFSEWRRKERNNQNLRQQEIYWLNRFAGEIPVMNLPLDFPRPGQQSFAGKTLEFHLGASQTDALKKLIVKQDVTLHMMFLAIYSILLSRLGSQEDIVVGIPTAGRRHADLEPIVGMFVNTLAIRNRVWGDMPFTGFLKAVRQKIVEAFENQDYPFEELVEHVTTAGDTGRNPLFDTMFTLRNQGFTRKEIPGLKLKPYPLESGVSKFDLSLEVIDWGDKLQLVLEYCTTLFKKETIRRFIIYINTIVSSILLRQHTRICEIEMMTGEEKNRVLYELNDTKAGYPREKTLHRMFAERVEQNPHHVALVRKDKRLTYGELNRRANRLAAILRDRGVKRDSIVILLVERSLEMVISMLGVWKSGGAYLPTALDCPLERLHYILEDCRGKWILTKGFTIPASAGQWQEVDWMHLDSLDLSQVDGGNLKRVNNSRSLAYVIYTSGTTGTPKGVLVEHRSVVNLFTWYARTFGLDSSNHVLQVSSYTFDPTVEQIFGTLLQGVVLYIGDSGLAADPHEFFQFIKKNRIHFFNYIPGFLKQLFSHEDAPGSLHTILSGGDRLDDHIKDLILNKGCKMYNHYGPTETTVDALTEKCTAASVTLGNPIANTQCYIVDSYGKPVPIGVLGELYISGAGVARGYLNRPELTREKFVDNYFVEPQQRKMYRTGDLVRRLHRGNIQFIGRTDHQVKIRGLRIELAEIENRLVKKESIREAVVLVKENKHGEKYLCAYIVSEVPLPAPELREYLSRYLPDYMIPVYFVPLQKLPLLPNGKLNRKGLPEPGPGAQAGEYAAPQDNIEVKLVKIWSGVLGIEEKNISTNENFFALGGHSLKANMMAGKIHKAFNLELSLAEVFKYPTIRGLARCINTSTQSGYAAVEPAEKKEYYRLSSAQKRLYVLQQLDEQGKRIAYNMPSIFVLAGKIDKDKFENTFKQIIARHESFRTSFHTVGDEPIQRIHKKVKFEIGEGISRDSKGGYARFINDFVRPFDLTGPPLLRVEFIKEEKQKTVLLVDMHHIISDGMSIGIFITEFMGLHAGHAGKEPASLKLQYKDFSEWHNKQVRKDAVRRQKTYWIKQFAGEVPVLNLPVDFPRAAVQDFSGHTLSFEIDKQQTSALKSLAQQQNVTLFMLLLAVYTVFLSKLSAQEDIVVGTPTAGRQHEDLKNIIGMFVNTLALRNFPLAQLSFNQFLEEIKAHTINAFQNQDFLYEDLVEQVEIQRDTSRNPLFDTMFVLQDMHSPAVEIPGLKITPCEYESRIAKFDLMLTASEARDCLVFRFAYCTGLFKEETVRRFIDFLKNAISALLENDEIRISGLEIISSQEKERILREFNDTAAAGLQCPWHKPIHRLFEEQAEQIPGRTAAGCDREDNHSVTYRELQRRIANVAYWLKEKGVGADTIVGIKVERSIEMVIGILSILKAGGAYLPIDPDYPPERIRYILDDSKATMLLTGQDMAPSGSRRFDSFPSTQPSVNPLILHHPNNLAYVIYTSGSTGKPKGVTVALRSVLNLVVRLQNQYPLEEWGVYLLKTSFIFDVSVSELFGWFPGGGRLAILKPGDEKDPAAILDTIERSRVTHINFVPSMFRVFLEMFYPGDIKKATKLSYLKFIFLAGEALLPGIVQKARCLGITCALENLYGPTEATVYASFFPMAQWHEPGPVPIGKPLADNRLYILDRDFHILPIGIPGQLCINGVGLARGYLNNPELTASAFIRLQHSSFTHRRIYCSGDLARWLPDGNIEFLGRMDHQVKIRGFRIELGEIENHLLKHNKVKEAIVITGEGEDNNRDKYLCAYVTAQSGEARKINQSELREYLGNRLPDYMIPAFFVQIHQIPLTANGKIDRKALPAPEIPGENRFAAPRDDIQQKLVEIWSEILGIENKKISTTGNFFHLGGHSLKATVLVSRLHREFNIKVPLARIFKTPRIQGLAAYIKESSKSRYTLLEPVEKKEYYPLSSAQGRLYFLQQMDDRGGISYNMPSVWNLQGDLETEKLTGIFLCLIRRHESLRTFFTIVNDEPVQRVQEENETVIDQWSPGINESVNEFGKQGIDTDIEDIITNFIRPFDLSRAPLLRTQLIKKAANEHILMVDMHHIISDGLSIGIFLKEFTALYPGETLPGLKLQYKDYSQWQYKQAGKGLKKNQETFWLKQFQWEVPVLNLPVDFVRPAIRDFAGRTMHFELEIVETSALKSLARQLDVTLFMLLLCMYNVFLSKISNQEDIVVGTPVAGRRHAEIENIMGMFVNTLALRNFSLPRKNFPGFLNEIKENTLNAFENQDYLYEDLVDQVVKQRDTGRNPLFDTVFTLQNDETPAIYLPGLKVSPYGYERRAAKFDLTLIAIEKQDRLSFTFEYATRLFREETICRFMIFFRQTVSFVLAHPATALAEIEIITGQEKKLILRHFNDTVTEYPLDKEIHRLFAEQVERTPDNIALHDSSKSTQSRTPEQKALTYKELDRQSDHLACWLREAGVKTDVIVGIMLERSLEMIIGVLGILKAGGAYLPVDPGYPAERINFMPADSSAGIMITNRELAGKIVNCQLFLMDSQLTAPAVPGLPMSLDPGPGPVNRPLAYVIYTSGTAGRPKGVMVDHHSVNRLVINSDFITLEKNDRILQTGALEFDASTFEIWASLLNGLTLYLEDKENILIAENLKKIIITHNITVMWLTAPLFNRLVQEDVEIFAGLANLLVGGDVLSVTHINLLRDRFPRMRIINGYGPTENTTFSTTFSIEREYREAIPIGKPISNSKCYILNKNGQLQPVGPVGELYVGGDGLARGYLNNPELTAGRFILTTKTKSQSHKDVYFSWCPGVLVAKLYRTGDLARWQPDGNIEFLGRIDLQVKIRGFRIELGEIETRLLAHEKIKEAVVLTREENNDKYICAYIVVKPGETNFIDNDNPGHPGIRDYLSTHLPDYMIPSYFVPLDNIPLTPNGKVDRKMLPAPSVINDKHHEAPRDDIERKLANLWSGILEVEKDRIGIETDFFHLGGHSLKAAMLASRIHKEFNIHIPLTRIFVTPHISGLAAYIKEAGGSTYIYTYKPVQPVEKKEYYALSSAQRRLFFLWQMDAGKGTAYNIPLALQLDGQVDREKIEGVFRRLIRRHEGLRTSFIMVKDEPVQQVHDRIAAVDWSLTVEETGKSKIEDIIRRFVRPFNLSRTPLLRAELIESAEQKSILVTDMHHIISDGLSIKIIVNEFMKLYSEKKLSALKLQYKDYSEWHNQRAGKESLKQQETFWLKQFAHEIPVLTMPVDYPRPVVQDFTGETLHFEFGIEETSTLKTLARQQDVTLFMLLLCIYNVFLAKLSGQEDIVVGTPVSGRRHSDAENIIGMFVNTLALRNFPLGAKSFRTWLGEVKERTLAAFENQDYLYEDLVELAPVERDTGRNPLFDTMFTLQNMDIPALRIPGLKVGSYHYENRVSKFDLTLRAVEIENRLGFTLEYGTMLFKRETIRRFVDFFKKTIAQILEYPDTRISEIEIITQEEKNRILLDFNGTGREYPREKTLHRLFAEQVEQRPNQVALLGPKSRVSHPRGETKNEEIFITYRQLNNHAGQLADLLKKKGVKPDMIVGIMLGQSIDMIIGIMGILKAGAAYLPIDPEYPPERVHYMLADSGARVLVSDLCEYSKEIESVQLDSLNNKPPDNRPGNQRVHPFHLGYVIYTSGSTGNPKGVMVTHKNVVNLVYGLKANVYGNALRPLRACLVAPFVFDASVKQIFGVLLQGHSLYIVPADARLDGAGLIQFYRKHRIHITDGTPAHLRLMLQDYKVNLSYPEIENYIIGGEALPKMLVEEFFNRFRVPGSGITGITRITNVYGPTECCVDSSSYTISGDNLEKSDLISIGKPMPNQQIFILDRENNIQPMGIPGELCIGGDSVSRGYLNRPELSAEKFVFVTHLYPVTKRVYKTGDLARWLPEGNIEFLDRIDHQVKVRGFRIEIGEIQGKLLRHQYIKDAAVNVIRHREEKSLCAYIVSSQTLTPLQLRQYLAAILPAYMIPSYFMFLDKIPKTNSGKIDRKSLPEPGSAAISEYIPPRDELERKLTGIWAQVLGLEKNAVGIDHNFFVLGGHSLKAGILIAGIHRELDVNVPLTAIFRTPTVRGLSEYINGAVKNKYKTIEPVETKEYYPVFSAQKRIYLSHEIDNRNVGYNLLHVVPLGKNIDIEKIKASLKQLVYRHESLRTSFKIVNGQIVQEIHGDCSFTIEHFRLNNSVDNTGASSPRVDELADDFIRPFDLSAPPLFRVGLIETVNKKGEGEEKGEKKDYILIFDIHHIITDGRSQEILTQQLYSLYNGKELSPLRLQYKDFSTWHNLPGQNLSMKRKEEFWTGQLKDKITLLTLPIDFKRPPVLTSEGDIVRFNLDSRQTGGLEKMRIETGTTMFMVLTAIYSVFLAKIANQEDILVGIPIAGRRHSDLQKISGMFVNTLVMKTQPASEKLFPELLREIKEYALNAFENQEFQFENLVEIVAKKRNAGRNPIFDTMFSYHNVEKNNKNNKVKRETVDSELELVSQQYDYKYKTSLFDLSLVIMDQEDTLKCIFFYNVNLFKKKTVRGFVRHFQKTVDSLVARPGIKLGEIEILSQQEKQRFIRKIENNRPTLEPEAEKRETGKDEAPGKEERPVAPANETEQKIRALWETILGVKISDVTADFFQVGGSSIEALLLVTEINKTFETGLLVTDIYENETIGKQAALVERTEKRGKNKKSAREKTIFKLKLGSRGSKNIFLIHDGTGKVSKYRPFCKGLKTGDHYWGLELSRAVSDSLAPQVVNIKDLASEYIASIKQVQARGPYYFGGWSIGGLIAFEMARQLEQAGEIVAHLSMFDTAVPGKNQPSQPFDLTNELELIHRYFQVPVTVTDGFKAADPADLWQKFLNFIEHDDTYNQVYILEKMAEYSELISDFHKLPGTEMFKYLNSFRSAARAGSTYHPATGIKINTALQYYQAELSDRSAAGWQDFFKNKIDFYRTGGNHFNMFNPPHLQSLIAVFQKQNYTNTG